MGEPEAAFVEPNGEESMKTISAGCDVLIYDDAANPVVAMPLFAFYDPSKGGSLGALFWCERGRREADTTRTLVLDEVRDVYVGKHTVAFQSEAAAASYEDHCFSLCGGQFTLNVEVKSADELEVWMAAVKFILTSSGRIVKDEDTVDPALAANANTNGVNDTSTPAASPNVTNVPPNTDIAATTPAPTPTPAPAAPQATVSVPVATTPATTVAATPSPVPVSTPTPAATPATTTATTTGSGAGHVGSGNNRSRGQSLAQQIAAVQHGATKHTGGEEKKIVNILGTPRVPLPLEALLDKMSPAVLRGWQPRWFVLSDEGISYYKSAADFKNGAWPTGVIPIRHVEKIEKLSGAGEFQICIPTSEGGPGRSRHLHVSPNPSLPHGQPSTNAPLSAAAAAAASSSSTASAISSAPGAATPGRKKNMLLRASSADQRDLWCRAIEQAVAVHQEKRRLSFVRW